MESTFSGSRKRRLLPILVVLWCLTPIASYAQEAVILGRVTDESGAVLPGVTVTATSPALQIPQVLATTDDRGEYRLASLPIGTYAVVYALGGFESIRRPDLRLTIGFQAKVDIILKLGTLSESVTVSGAAPVVDVTSTSSQTQLTRETLELIPTGRNSIVGLMIQAPGARPQLDWTFTTGNPFFKVFGELGEQWVALEGVVTSGPKTGTQGGNDYDYAAIEESTISTVGNTAQAPTKGLQINVLLKAGGNDFHGSAFYAATGHRLESGNVDDKLRALGITSGNPVNSRFDTSAELGGRIIPNKLWFYYSTRRRGEKVQQLNSFQDNGRPGASDQFQLFHTAKFSYQMNAKDKFIGFVAYNNQGGMAPGTALATWDYRLYSPRRSTVSKIEWQTVRGNTFVSLQVGAWIWNQVRQCYSSNTATRDLLNGRLSGCNTNYGLDSFEGRNHSKGSMSWYKPDLFVGNHDLKVGFDYAAAHADRKVSSRDGSKNPIFPLKSAPGNLELLFRNGVPFEIAAWSNSYKDGLPDSVPKDLTHTTWLYAQDSWTIARQLTLNLGARFAHAAGVIPEQCTNAADAPFETVYPAQCFQRIEFRTWNSLVPRLHAAYDLSGNHKTVIKGGFGRFAHNWHSDELQMANGNVHLSTLFLWHDINGNKLFEPGEVNLDRNGADFVSTSLFTGGEDGLAGAVSNPNIKEPMSNEWSVSLERELMQNFALRATGIYSRQQVFRVQNNLRPYNVYSIPITNPDPGPDGRLGTADDTGKLITYYDYPAAYRGRQFQQPMLINGSSADDETFKSVEIAASKRLSNRWSLLASYSATKIYIPSVQNTASTGNDFTNPGLQVFLATYDPNAEINTKTDLWESQARLDGAYILPHDMLLSANFEHRSGSPYARTVSFTGGQQIPSLVVRVEPIGAQHLPNINLLHVRFEKSLKMARGQKVALRMNVYNLTNINTTQTLTQLSGVNFQKPLSILSPRIVEFGVNYAF